MSEIRRHLEHILTSGDFSLLEPLKRRKGWVHWLPEERELLAKALVQQGREKLLSNQSATAHQELSECFALALQIAPSNSRIYWEQAGVLLKSYTCCARKADLQLAIELLEKALACSSSDLRCLIALDLVKATMQLSDYPKDSEQVRRVDQLLTSCSNSLPHDSRRAGKVLQAWGEHYLHLGVHSGEAWELRCAVEKFRAAADLLAVDERDWRSTCQALDQLARLTKQIAFYREAIKCLRLQLSISHQSEDLWSRLGDISQKIYEMTGIHADYLYAERCFGNAVLLAPEKWQSWFRWGLLYIKAGRARQQIALLRFGLEKLTKADKLSPGQPLINSQIADCQCMIGSIDEDLGLLKQANRCLQRCIELEPFESLHVSRLGMCHLAMGGYFGDNQQFVKAYTFFQEAEVAFGNLPELQMGLALCCCALAETALEPQLMQKALEHFEKGQELASCQVDYLIDWATALMRFAEICGGDREMIEAALSKLQEALKLCDRLEIGPTANLLYHFGCALDFMGDLTGEEAFYEQAIHALSKAVQIDPDHYSARFNLAIVHSHIGETFEEGKSLLLAISHFEALAQTDREDELVWQEWGIALLHLAELTQGEEETLSLPLLEEAEAKLRQALRLGALTPLYHLAGLHSVQGQIETALHYLDRSIEEKIIPGVEEIEEDEWLDSLRQHPRYLKLMLKFKETLAKEESGEAQPDSAD